MQMNVLVHNAIRCTAHIGFSPLLRPSTKRRYRRFKGALAIHEGAWGQDHPSTIISREVLAGAYAKSGSLEKALTLQQDVVAAFERVLGCDHRDTINSVSDLAALHTQLVRTSREREIYGLVDPALSHVRRVLSIVGLKKKERFTNIISLVERKVIQFPV